MSTSDADRYAAISTVFAAIDAMHHEDAVRVQSLVRGMKLRDFIIAALTVCEIVMAVLAERLAVSFDIVLTDIRNQVLGKEFDGDGAA